MSLLPFKKLTLNKKTSLKKTKKSNTAKNVDNATYQAEDNNNLNSKTKRIAIIGSGVSGLTCAHYLVNMPNTDVTIFEANDYVGGHVNTIDVVLANDKKSAKRYAKTVSKSNSKLSSQASATLNTANSSIKGVEVSAIDTGFIVFNERTYPNFFRLLNELNVPFQVTDMSFSVKNPALNLEYNGHTLNTLISQRRNLLSPKFWRFVQDILAFNKHIKALLNEFASAKKSGNHLAVSKLSEQTLGDYLASARYGKLFTDNYILPMVSAIWSMGLEDAKGFPLVFFAQFFDNHGLLDVVNRPRWFTIKGGSKQYVTKLVERFKAQGGQILLNSPVQRVIRLPEKNKVQISYQTSITKKNQTLNNTVDDVFDNVIDDTFDDVIFACHADTALKLLGDANTTEQEILSAFRFSDNEAILHTDTSVLPNKPLAWASWNYLMPDVDTSFKNGTKNSNTNTSQLSTSKPVLTYHMNILQRLSKRHNYLVTLNHKVDDKQVIKRIDYRHPVYDQTMVQAQSRWHELSELSIGSTGNVGETTATHTHFCGAYWFNGFHEDGVRSGLRVCQTLGVDVDIKEVVNPEHLGLIAQPDTPFNINKLPVKADKKARKLNKRQIVQAENLY